MANATDDLDRIEIIQHIAEYARQELQLGTDNQKLMFAFGEKRCFCV